MTQNLGREPKPEELATELRMDIGEVRELLRLAQQPISLERPVGEDEDSSLGDFVEDEAAPSPFDEASRTLRETDIRRALDTLPERERQVLELRFGLTGDQAADARGGRARVRGDPRADSPDREQHPAQAQGAARGAAPDRVGLARRAAGAERRGKRGQR